MSELFRALKGILLWIRRNPGKTLEIIRAGKEALDKYTCNEPECWRTTLDGSPYCEEHTPSVAAYVIVVVLVLGGIAGLVYWLW